jgi:hypothetical protein
MFDPRIKEIADMAVKKSIRDVITFQTHERISAISRNMS